MDFLLRRMVHDIAEWYDKEFYPPNFNGNKHRKLYHIDMLQRYYQKRFFDDKFDKDLNGARVVFLTDLQTLVNNSLGGGGYG